MPKGRYKCFICDKCRPSQKLTLAKFGDKTSFFSLDGGGNKRIYFCRICWEKYKQIISNFCEILYKESGFLKKKVD